MIYRARVQTEPIAIEGVAGPVVVDVPSFGRPVIRVGYQDAPRVAGRRYALPGAAGGTVEATLRGGFADPYPTLDVNGIRYRTGPQSPSALRVLTMVPILLVGIGGLLGGLLGVVAVLVNVAIVRTQMSVTGKVLAVIGVIVAAAVAYFAIAATILGIAG